MMKSLIATITLVIFSINLYAQTNILEQLSIVNLLNDYSCEEHGDYYYFSTREEAGPLNTALHGRATRLSLNKYNKNTHQLVASIYIAGDTLQNDSIASGIYMVMRGRYIHINYGMQQRVNNTTVLYSHYVKLDTSLSVIVPDRELPQLTGPIALGGFASKPDGGCIMGYFSVPEIIGGTSKYLVLDSLGNVTDNDTLGARKSNGYYNNTLLKEIVELPDHNYLAIANGIAGESTQGSPFGWVVYNENMELLDTFNFKRGTQQDSMATYISPWLPKMIGLPSGSLISASDARITATGYENTYAKIVKHTQATRYGVDDYIAFGALSSTDTAHGNPSALKTIGYNPHDNNLYYASITHMAYMGLECAGNSDKSYLEIISVDTNLNTRWRKFIKMNGICSFMGTLSIPDGRNGVLIAGNSYQNDISIKDWVYYINDQTPSDTPTDITDITLKKEDGFVLYPNPAHNEVHLISDKELKEALLYDLSGRFILSQPIASGKATLNIDQLNPGIYLIKATDKGGRVYQKKVVKK
jgi:hypothetical protein